MKRVHEYKAFLSRFNFQKDMNGMIGVERERFLATPDGILVPRAQDFLLAVDDPRWIYELSACQIEDRTDPLRDVAKIQKALAKNDCQGRAIVKQLGLRLYVIEVAGEDMPLTVYPDQRYVRIKTKITKEQLSAACRVTATHLHFGVSSLEKAIQISNLLLQYIDLFRKLGDHSNGERLRLYKTMATHWRPPYYQSIEHLFEVAFKQGFVKNPRDCWHLIRISKHGTVELRMFGVTESLDEICQWIQIVKEIIKKELVP